MKKWRGRLLLGLVLLCGSLHVFFGNRTVFLLKQYADRAGMEETDEASAVVMLLTNRQEDIEDAIAAIQSLDRYLPAMPRTPLLIFNEGDLSKTQTRTLTNSTSRTLHFPLVNFSEFPTGFNPNNTTTTNQWTKRSKWGYHQMCRFWSTKVWEHEVLDGYSTIMRMDSDSSFVGKIPRGLLQLPPGIVYAANRIKLDPESMSTGIFDRACQYVQTLNISPKNEKLWRLAEATWLKKQGMPSFYNNFEVDRVSFFRREDVMDFQRAMTEQPPFGVFVHRWGDAVVRFLTIAIYAKPDELYQPHTNRFYLHPSPRSSHATVRRTRLAILGWCLLACHLPY